MKMNLIVAVDFNHCIGKDNGLPWHSTEDLKWFKQHTSGYSNNALIMGRKTWDSIPKSQRPLKGRKNIVLSRGGIDAHVMKERYPEVTVAKSLAHAVIAAQHADIAWVIGGSQVYKEALESDTIDEIYMTVFENVFEGDTYFPHIPVRDWIFTQLARGDDHLRYRITR